MAFDRPDDLSFAFAADIDCFHEGDLPPVHEPQGFDDPVPVLVESAVFAGAPGGIFAAGSSGSQQAATNSGAAGGPEYIQIVNNGPSDNRVDIWYVGDGYLESQRQEFIDDVMAQFADMTSNLTLNEPFVRYQNFFNVHAVFQPSAEAGADQPDAATPIFVDTAFDASYSWNGGVERLLYLNTSKANIAINSVMPAGADINMRFGVVNSFKYGGGGGSYAVFAGKNSSAFELALHEVGHSYANLADEYWTSGDTYTGGEPGIVNVTTDPTGVKWDHWIGYDDPNLGLVGAYEGAYYNEFGAYRPTLNSKMRTLNRAFDPIAKEKFILDYYLDVDPIDDVYFEYQSGVSVNPELWVDVIDTDVIQREWSINGVVDPNLTGSSVDLAALGLSKGTYQVTVRAYDDTDMVRRDQHLLEQTHEWFVAVEDGDFDGSSLDDILRGTDTSNTINALDGGDTIEGLGGEDTIIGGEGSDQIDGGNDGDLLFGDTEVDIAGLLASLGL